MAAVGSHHQYNSTSYDAMIYVMINYHSVFFTLAAIVTAIILRRLVRHDLKIEIPWYRVFEDVALVLFVGLIGARMLFALLNPSEVTSWLDYSAFWRPGLVSYGGIIAGVAAAALWFKRRAHGQVWWEALLIAGLFGWAVGRIGNFLQRDAYGIRDAQFDGIAYGRVPIQLYEMMGLLVLGIVAVTWWQNETRRGWVWWYVCAGYGVLRAAVDTWRDLPDVALGLNVSQLVGVILCIYGIIGLYIWKRKSRTR